MKSVTRVGPRGDTAGFMKAGVTRVDSSNVSVGFEPGFEWRYSGGGYAILQLLIEDVSGESFEALLLHVVAHRRTDPRDVLRSRLETGAPLLATRLAGEWTFWETGNVDFLMLTMAVPGMLRLIGFGSLVIVLVVPATAWWMQRAKRRRMLENRAA